MFINNNLCIICICFIFIILSEYSQGLRPVSIRNKYLKERKCAGNLN